MLCFVQETLNSNFVSCVDRLTDAALCFVQETLKSNIAGQGNKPGYQYSKLQFLLSSVTSTGRQAGRDTHTFMQACWLLEDLYMHTLRHTCVYTNACMYEHTHANTHTHMHTFACTHMHAHTHRCTHMHAHTYIHMHTHT